MKLSVMSLDSLKSWIKDYSATRVLTYRPSDLLHFVAFEIISANYDNLKAYFVEEAFLVIGLRVGIKSPPSRCCATDPRDHAVYFIGKTVVDIFVASPHRMQGRHYLLGSSYRTKPRSETHELSASVPEVRWQYFGGVS